MTALVESILQNDYNQDISYYLDYDWTNEELIETINTCVDDYERILKTNIASKYKHVMLANIIKKFIHLFTRLITNFSTIVTRFYKTVKRSELEFYIKSKPFNVRAVEKASFLDIGLFEIPYFPFKQKPDAVNKTLTSFIQKLSPKSSAKTIYTDLNNIINMMDSDESKDVVINQVNKLQQDCMNKYCQSVVTYLVTNVIIKPSTLNIKLNELFSSINDIKKQKVAILKYETQLYNEVSYVSTVVDKCDKQLTKFIKRVENNPSDDILKNKKQLQKFADVIRELGYYFETVGLLTKEVVHLSHHLVTVYEKINQQL